MKFATALVSLLSSSSTGKRMISSNVERTLDPCVVLMKDLIGQYADAWKDKGGIYSLAQGVVYWKPPEQAKQAVIDALDDDSTMLHMYGPDEGLLELRQMLEEKIKRENKLDNHKVMVTVGANQAYVNAVITLLDEKDKGIVFKPYYFNHVMAFQMLLPKESLVVGPSSSDGIPDLDWLEKQLAADPTIKMVTIVNPGNPTGIYIQRNVLQQAVDICAKHNCWLIMDNTYEYFLPHGDFDGCFSDAHVIHIFSLSKAYALAGYRCGYIVISNEAENVYSQMLKVQDTIPIAPSRISQIAAIGALQAGREWVREKVDTLADGRAAIIDAMKPLSQVMGGSGSMYLMGKLPDGANDEEIARLLVEKYGIAVIPGSFCGFPGWIRVCYANLPPNICLQAADRLHKGLTAIVSS